MPSPGSNFLPEACCSSPSPSEASNPSPNDHRFMQLKEALGFSRYSSEWQLGIDDVWRDDIAHHAGLSHNKDALGKQHLKILDEKSQHSQVWREWTDQGSSGLLVMAGYHRDPKASRPSCWLSPLAAGIFPHYIEGRSFSPFECSLRTSVFAYSTIGLQASDRGNMSLVGSFAHVLIRLIEQNWHLLEYKEDEEDEDEGLERQQAYGRVLKDIQEFSTAVKENDVKSDESWPKMLEAMMGIFREICLFKEDDHEEQDKPLSEEKITWIVLDRLDKELDPDTRMRALKLLADLVKYVGANVRVKIMVVVNGHKWETLEDDVAELSKDDGKNVFFCQWREGLEPGEKWRDEEAVEME